MTLTTRLRLRHSDFRRGQSHLLAYVFKMGSVLLRTREVYYGERGNDVYDTSQTGLCVLGALWGALTFAMVSHNLVVCVFEMGGLLLEARESRPRWLDLKVAVAVLQLLFCLAINFRSATFRLCNILWVSKQMGGSVCKRCVRFVTRGVDMEWKHMRTSYYVWIDVFFYVPCSMIAAFPPL
jgi:hypothetical protein